MPLPLQFTLQQLDNVGMLNCPVELWQSIFSHACTDGGRTGCSLALVSKYVREASAPFRYHSVMLEGTKRISLFLAILKKKHPRRTLDVLHLFVCDMHATYRPSTSSRNFMLLPENHERGMRLCELLSEISCSLETLTLYLHGVRRFLLSPISLPRLQELSIHGDHISSMDVINQVFPSLTTLTFEGSMLGRQHGSTKAVALLRTLPNSVPLLADLEVSQDSIFRSWEALVDRDHDGDPSQPTSLLELFPMLRSMRVRRVPSKRYRTEREGVAYRDWARATNLLPSEEPTIRSALLDAIPSLLVARSSNCSC